MDGAALRGRRMDIMLILGADATLGKEVCRVLMTWWRRGRRRADGLSRLAGSKQKDLVDWTF